MTDSQNDTQIEQGNTGQQHADGSTVLVTRGTKRLPKDTRVTVLGYDAVHDTYAVRDGLTGTIVNVKAGYVGPVPERTFTESEIVNGLTDLGLDGQAIMHDLINK